MSNRANHPTGERSGRDADATVPVRTTFLKSGEASSVHAHGPTTLWTHVVSGELVEDRWSRRPGAGFVHERRALRAGQAMAAPGEALHCVRARLDTVFVSTCACGCLAAEAVDPSWLQELRRSVPMELEVGSATVAGARAPD
jgi:hypothetical protein